METIIVTVLITLGAVALLAAIVVAFIMLRRKVGIKVFNEFQIFNDDRFAEAKRDDEEIRKIITQMEIDIRHDMCRGDEDVRTNVNDTYALLNRADENLMRNINEKEVALNRADEITNSKFDSRCDKLYHTLEEAQSVAKRHVLKK